MTYGLTFDTGALLAITARRAAMVKVFQAAQSKRVPITIPSPVVSEWWRSRADPLAAALLRACTVEPLTETIAKSAGLALGRLGGGREHTIDAIVVASAATRGDVIYTSDPDDLERFVSVFPAVRIRSVNDP